jgi:predicted O-methyltransferase YrrM
MLNNLCRLEGSSLTSIDPYRVGNKKCQVKTDTYKLFRHNMSLCKERKKFDQHIGYSKNILPKLIEQNKIYDIIYIDGSPLMHDVLTDMMYSNQMLRKGGIMLLDDAGFNQDFDRDVMGAIKKFLSEYSDSYTVILKEWQWMLKKTE